MPPTAANAAAPSLQPASDAATSAPNNTTKGMTAVLWAYVVPFVVLLGALVAASLAGWSDGAAALAAVGGIALYYGTLYLLRERLEKKIHFKIHKQ